LSNQVISQDISKMPMTSANIPQYASTSGMADLIVTDVNDALIDKVEPDPHRLALTVMIVTAVRSLEDAHGFLMPNGLTDSPTTRNAITLANAM
jgi:hypothetical protein